MPGSNNITEPPDELDGAKVIQWAWSGDKPFGFLPMAGDNSIELIEIVGLAICRYDNSPVVYRFSCDRNWEVQQDGEYDSVEDALNQLPAQYQLVTAQWVNR